MKPARLLFALCFILSALSSKSQIGSTNASSYKLFFEKTYLHTDRETYAGGEDIWFKAYLVNGQTNVLSPTSNNLYTELINPAGVIADRKVIRLDAGLGNGEFHLADSIPAGTYRIRAYTSWMRNFGDNFIFEKKVRVFSSLDPEEKVAGSGKTKPKAANSPSAPPTATPATLVAIPSLRFFPEAGDLIDGVAALVAFKSEAVATAGIALRGNVFSSSGEMVAEFSCDTLGMGSFLLPGGQGYMAKGSFADGSSFSLPLPAALATGFSLFVRNTDSLIRVTISTNAATLSQLTGTSLVLLGKSKGKTVYTAQIPLNDLQSSLSVAKAGLPGGILSLVLYDSSGKPQCERLVYVEGKEQVKLSVTTDKPSYAPKGKVTVTLKAGDEAGLPVKANLSLAAVDAGLIPVNEGNIVSYLDLSSEIRGTIRNAAQYFDPANPNRKQSLDLLLLTQGWRDFTWKRLADSALKISYPLEQGITISGSVTDKGKPVKMANITLSAPGAKGARLLAAKTDSAGKYYFDNVGLYGHQTLRLSSKNDKGEKNGSLLLDSLFLEPPAAGKTTAIIPLTLASAEAKPVQSPFQVRSANARKFSQFDTIGFKEIKITERNYIRLSDQNVTSFGYKDEVFNIQPTDYGMKSIFDYLQHYSKAEVGDVIFLVDQMTGESQPLKPSVALLNGDVTAYYKLLYYTSNGDYSFPRLFVDGREMPYTDDNKDLEMMQNYQNTYFSLPLTSVRKIVIKHMIGPPKTIAASKTSTVNVFGASVQKMASLSPVHDVYIVYLTLQPGAMDIQNHSLITVPVNGYSEAQTFYAPIYDTPSIKPDLRTTFHWEPMITTNEKGEATITYYNADPTTNVRIVAEGISEKGVAMTGTRVYQVK